MGRFTNFLLGLIGKKKAEIQEPAKPIKRKPREPVEIDHEQNMKQWKKMYGDVDPEDGMNPHERAAHRYNKDPDVYDRMNHAASQKALYDTKPPNYNRPKARKKYDKTKLSRMQQRLDDKTPIDFGIKESIENPVKHYVDRLNSAGANSEELHKIHDEIKNNKDLTAGHIISIGDKYGIQSTEPKSKEEGHDHIKRRIIEKVRFKKLCDIASKVRI